MNKVKVYYNPEKGYELFMPDGQFIPLLRNISVHDNWIESTNKTGEPTRIQDAATADVNLYVEVVNEPPLHITEDSDINDIIQRHKTEKGLNVGMVSDGFHTFHELYAHRIALFKVVCQYMHRLNYEAVWKSKRHSDGSEYDGWFIAGIYEWDGMQITYHIPISEWDSWPGTEKDKAPEYDGHTSADVLKRLAEL